MFTFFLTTIYINNYVRIHTFDANKRQSLIKDFLARHVYLNMYVCKYNVAKVNYYANYTYIINYDYKLKS